ncbi:MAG: GNAT family N-acetyltransferase [Oscillospiraceae bacterium]|nr:GNAT family N-acetyltransferase [Oscillospiraceae bacterium]
MIHIKMIKLPDEKTAITLKIMHSLPVWFSPPESIEKHAITHRDYPFLVAFDDDAPIGFTTLKIHNKYTADIYNMGILEQYHRRGIGRQLVESAERYCTENELLYLTVKTLDSSAEYEPYNRTRAFYLNMGFTPLEVFTTFWNEENPCLFLVKRLDNSDTKAVLDKC